MQDPKSKRSSYSGSWKRGWVWVFLEGWFEWLAVRWWAAWLVGKLCGRAAGWSAHGERSKRMSHSEYGYGC